MHRSLPVLLWLSTAPLPLLAQARPSSTPAEAAACENAHWRLVFQNDAQGRDIGGDRGHLVNALRRGSPIRVAWGEKLPDGRSVVEFAEPAFTSLMGERDVVVQFPEVLIQTDYLDATKAALRDPPLVWRGLMSTDGRFDAVMVDQETGKVVRRLAQRASMTWYALAPAAGCDDRPTPMLARPGGVRLDSTAAAARP